jgi:hypothetical protein
MTGFAQRYGAAEPATALEAEPRKPPTFRPCHDCCHGGPPRWRSHNPRANPTRSGMVESDGNSSIDAAHALANRSSVPATGWRAVQPGSRPFVLKAAAAAGAVKNFTHALAASTCLAPTWMPVEKTVIC